MLNEKTFKRLNYLTIYHSFLTYSIKKDYDMCEKIGHHMDQIWDGLDKENQEWLTKILTIDNINYGIPFLKFVEQCIYDVYNSENLA